MRTLGHLLSSKAKTEVLRALHYQCAPVGLRQLSRIAGVAVRSAELALDALVEDKVVKRTRKSKQVLYTMDRKHRSAFVLAEVFEAAELAALRADSHCLNAKAKRIIPFIEETIRMLEHARGTRHVT